MKQFLPGLVLLSIFLMGCASKNYGEQYLAAHPDEDPGIVRLIKQKKIREGMTKGQVRAAWGNPCRNCAGNRKLEILGVTKETSVYEEEGLGESRDSDIDLFGRYFLNRKYVYFENGRVVDWTD